MKHEHLRLHVLACLSTTSWKRARKVSEELDKKLGEDVVSDPQVYACLLRLEHDGFIESQVQRAGMKHKYREYRKKTGGKKAKNVQSSRRNFGLLPQRI